MSLLLGLRHRLRALLFPRAHARDLADEMALHRELDAMQDGAGREAALRFGNQTYYREEVRRMTWYGALDATRQDARYAWRSITRNPGFTAMVVLTLALGIGVNAASFSVLDLLFLRPPAGIEEPSTLRRVHVEHFRSGDGVPFLSQSLNYPMYREMMATLGDPGQAALFTTDFALRMGKHPRDPRLRGVYASASYFPLLGVRAAIGRVYGADEDRMGSGEPVAVVSHRFWRTQFGGDTAAIGRTIAVGGMRYTIVGVLDPAFGGTDLQHCDVWMPLATLPPPSWLKGPWWEEYDNMMRFQSLYRLAPGMTEAQIALRATERFRALERRSDPRHPDTLITVHSGNLMEARGPAKLGADLVISSRLSGVALIVLLIACANVVNLLLARAVRRRHEFSIRLALGISRSRLTRMLTTETLLLAMLATIPAMLAAWWGGTVLRSLLLPGVTWYDTALTWRVVAFAVGLALFAGLVAGIVPALQAASPDLTRALKSPRTGAAHRSRLRSTLVIAQAALTLVLLVGSALFIRSLHNVQALDIGFDANRLVFGAVSFAEGEAPPGVVVDAALRDIGTRLRGRAAVTSVAHAWIEPMQGLAWLDFFTTRDSLGSFRTHEPTVSAVSPSFFATVGLRLSRGRAFGGSDVGGSAAPLEAVVNEALAGRLWPGENPIGQCLRLKTRDAPCHTVVGVVENARQSSVIEEQAAFQFYIPLGSPAAPRFASRVILRTDGPTATAVDALGGELRRAFPAGEPSIRTMTENLEPEYRPWRLGASLFTAVGGLALLVALIGIYSTVSYGVAQRTHEFGVRIALGARLTDLLRQVIGEGVRTVLVGVVVGVLLALAAGRLVASLLYGVRANDPLTMGAVALLLLLVAAIAAVVPAWRASRVDPVTALRAE